MALMVTHGNSKEQVLGERVPTFYLSFATALKKECEERRKRNPEQIPPVLDHGMLVEKMQKLKIYYEPIHESDLYHAVTFMHDTGQLI